MAVDAKHPLYGAKYKLWQQMSDCYAGEATIKEKGEIYLPPTAGHRADGYPNPNTKGKQAYDAYKQRAVFPSYTRDAVDKMVGIMHREPARIELPAKLKPLIEKATADGESLEQLLRRINTAQLREGRFGLLLEAPQDKLVNEALPFIATYPAVTIINWDKGQKGQGIQKLELVVLDESEFQRTSELTWEFKDKHRVLMLSDTLRRMYQVDQSAIPAGAYVAAVVRDKSDINPADFIAPSIGGKTLDRIPFVFVNAIDLLPDPDDPPLLGLSNKCLAIYRGEADYRQSLHLQGQETFVMIGGAVGGGPTNGDPAGAQEGQVRVGAGSFIELPSGGDAKYVGVSADGLAEQRQAIENDRREAGDMSTNMLDVGSNDEQSGDALRIRMAAATATLTSIAKTGAGALADILRTAAEWVGANPNEVVVEPNLDFADDQLSAQELVQYMTAKQLGAPISLKSIHRIMKKRDLTEMEFEDEVAEIEDEAQLALGNPDGGTEDEDEQRLGQDDEFDGGTGKRTPPGPAE